MPEEDGNDSNTEVGASGNASETEPLIEYYSSQNLVRKVEMDANHAILTTLLRGELNFKGLAVTDWEDIIKLHKEHKVAKDMRDAVKLAVLAGIDMSMTPNDYSFNLISVTLSKKISILMFYP